MRKRDTATSDTTVIDPLTPPSSSAPSIHTQSMATNLINQHIRIRQVAVLGAGVMGAQIAAHLVNARVPVILFDLASAEGPKSSIAQRAIKQLAKQSPAPLGLATDAQYIQAANYDDHLDLLGQCDLVIEAIAERLDWKQALYQKIAPHLAPHAILASNTSGLSINALAQSLPANIQPRFCGIHFFNPPRYMHLLELIPTSHTAPALLDGLETFITQTLGKGVVRAQDTPNFIANRVGVFSILAVIHHTEKFGLPYDLVDDLTGVRLGRPKSATFRTADVVGLDVLAHVIKTMEDGLPKDPFHAIYKVPASLQTLLEQKAFGQKTGAGFYRKEGKQIQVLDHQNSAKQLTYQAVGNQADSLITRILKRPQAERLALLRDSDHPQAQFLWAIFRDVFHYIALHLEEIADNARDLDFAIRWGFGWERGPFEEWQAAGWTQVAQWIEEDIAAKKTLCSTPLPAWVLNGEVAQRGGVHQAEGSWSAKQKRFVARRQLPVYEQQIFPAALQVNGKSAAETFDTMPQVANIEHENEAVRIWTSRDHADILIVSFKTKMNTISPDTLDGIQQAVTIAEQGYSGLVIWQPTSLQLGTPGGPFSAGANLEAAMPIFMQHGAAAVEPFVAKFQQTMMRVKYAQVPVISAVSGIALGGACELLLHSARRVAAFESYIGLVEAGVGLLPAGGGLKEIAIRAAAAVQASDDNNYLQFIKQPFQNAAMARVSSCALEAKQMGYLQASDPIVLNVHDLLSTALNEARQLAAAGWRPPLPAKQIAVGGRNVYATLQAQLVNLREGKFISEHDETIAKRIAEVICGGDLDAGTLVDENWLLKLERQAFIDLLATSKTQERIMGMLQTGKPVRN